MPTLRNLALPEGDLPAHLIYNFENGDPPSKPQTEFMIAMDRIVYQVSLSFTDQNRRTRVLERIVSMINAKLAAGVQSNADYDQMRDSAQLAIIVEAREVRTEYIKNFLKYAKFSIVVAVLFIASWLFGIIKLPYITEMLAPLENPGAIINVFGTIGFTLAGLVLGAGFSIFMTNRHLSIENFDQIQRYYFSISTYFNYLYFLTALILVVLYFEAVVLGFGPIILNNVFSEPHLGVLVGLLCGISESLMAEIGIQIAKPSRKTQP